MICHIPSLGCKTLLPRNPRLRNNEISTNIESDQKKPTSEVKEENECGKYPKFNSLQYKGSPKKRGEGSSDSVSEPARNW